MKLPTIRSGAAWSVLLWLAGSASGAEFVVDGSRSKVEVAVHATADSFTGNLEKFEPSIQVDKETGLPTGGTFAWDFKDLKTGSARRDKEMLHWLEHDQIPKAVFTFKKCAEKSGQPFITGDLKMHGVVHEITMPLQVTRRNGELSWESSLVLDHRPHGLPKIVKFALLKVDPNLKIHFVLTGSVKE
jgi:polyisoprenoid-binding protein YceI